MRTEAIIRPDEDVRIRVCGYDFTVSASSLQSLHEQLVSAVGTGTLITTMWQTSVGGDEQRETVEVSLDEEYDRQVKWDVAQMLERYHKHWEQQGTFEGYAIDVPPNMTAKLFSRLLDYLQIPIEANTPQVPSAAQLAHPHAQAATAPVCICSLKFLTIASCWEFNALHGNQEKATKFVAYHLKPALFNFAFSEACLKLLVGLNLAPSKAKVDEAILSLSCYESNRPSEGWNRSTQRYAPDVSTNWILSLFCTAPGRGAVIRQIASDNDFRGITALWVERTDVRGKTVPALLLSLDLDDVDGQIWYDM
mmetsp:Transcript_8220/g.23381  ORF Transcript_8220/g.23381 Transcript_8220/m.23381 type:complete len:308 (-) Transcript_8220:1220-2143(-)